MHPKCEISVAASCDHRFGTADEDSLPVAAIRVKLGAFVRTYDHKSASINQNRGSVSVW